MSGTRRIVVSLPAALLEEVNGIAARERKNRSELIREAMRRYITDKKRLELREQLKHGYREMAPLNRLLAEEGIHLAGESLALAAQGSKAK